MKKLKVVTVVGTRPEIIRLSRVMAKLDEHCEHVLVHTGQNYDYELNQIFFDDLGIRKPDHFLNAAGASGSETIGNVIIANKSYRRLGCVGGCVGRVASKNFQLILMRVGNLLLAPCIVIQDPKSRRP